MNIGKNLEYKLDTDMVGKKLCQIRQMKKNKIILIAIVGIKKGGSYHSMKKDA